MFATCEGATELMRLGDGKHLNHYFHTAAHKTITDGTEKKALAH